MAHGISVPSGGRAASRGSKRLLALRGDDHLVERLRHGDEAAFEVIYERHVHGLLSFCRHMLSSREEAEDAVQHAFTAAHRDLLRDDREIRLKAWLYAIARNRCVSMLRARREQPDERVEASTDGLDTEVQRRADLRQLMEDLQDLPEDQRAALVLSELRDLSHAEVADVLGCRVANVKGLVFRARAGLSERREARDTECATIREELAIAHGGTLRRGRLRHHLRACAPCSA
ncbi:MAG: RNA polymerase sigma factor, partial [Gammaproteobacteria bacterium]